MTYQPHIEIYTTMTCPSCIRAKRLFQSRDVDYEEIDVSFDRTAMVARASGRTTVPQIFIDGKGIGGFDDLVALDREGRLDELLEGSASER
jgi:glutaredoxin 3